MTQGVWWLIRRILLPIAIATLIGKAAFAYATFGVVTLSALFIDMEDLAITAGLFTVILLGVLAAAYALRRTHWHPAIRVTLLALAGALTGFLLIYALTDVTAYANLAIPPAIVAAIVWLLCNIDLLKRFKKEPILG